MATGTWIYEKGSVTGGGGGTGGGLPAPPVSIDPVVEVVFRSDHRVEVDVPWTANALATAKNFLGCAVYLEDPDISSGENQPLGTGGGAPTDGMPLDATAQVSGDWAPIPVGDSTKSPAVVFLDSTMGSTPGQTYKAPRKVRIYLAAYGPSTHAHLVRATDPNPTPNIVVQIPLARGQGESGQEYAFLVTNVSVAVTADYNRPDPKYYITFRYQPPDPATPVPPGMNHFGGVRIIFVYLDADGNPMFGSGPQPPTDTGINIPVDQAATGFKSSTWDAGPAGGKFRCYFCSEDDSQPLGQHINSLVEGVTPFAVAIVPPVPTTPNVGNFSISNQTILWSLDGSFFAQATFAWSLPDEASGSIRYAGVYLYLVNVSGQTQPLSAFPRPLTAQQSNVDTSFILDIPNVPGNHETWTIAAISVDNNGNLKDDPAKYGQPGFTAPIVTWDIGPPTPGSAGSGSEHAPMVTIDPGATAAASQSISSDGVGMVSFNVGTWTNPTDNQFGNAQVLMVVNNDPTKPYHWTVPANANSFTTPPIPSFGNIGSPVEVDFYVVSDDPQGNKNQLVIGTTPVIKYVYTPAAGAIIPARSGWFDESQFSWVDGSGLTADNIEANNIYVGRTLVVGGSNDTSFAGQANGQIAVKNSSGVLRAWMGEQQPGQGTGAGLWGAWFGQAWIGGTNPLDAPLWIDNQGIIEVGGIAAAHGAQYPYISVRDQTGLEMGRVGAALNVPSGSLGDGVGSNPPQITAGAWFTQLAVGGSNLSNWNVLIIPDTTNPLGSQFLMRNIHQLQVDYAAQFGSPANNEYKLEFGNSVWSTGTGAGSWQFPGIHLYEVDNSGNSFGAVYLNRGMVLKGRGEHGYPVLASLVTYNGQASGSDIPPEFWGELALYSSLNPYTRTVYLASASAGSGDPQFVMAGNDGKLRFQVDPTGNVFVAGQLRGVNTPAGATTPVAAYAYNVSGTGGVAVPVIDATGAWVGKPITVSGGQTPWTGPINAAGFALNGAGSISATQYVVGPATNPPVIDSNGKFLGAGVDVTTHGTAYGIQCGALVVTTPGEIDCGLVYSRSNFVCGGTAPGSLSGTGWVAADNIKCVGNVQANQYLLASGSPVINSSGQFLGAGVLCWSYGIGCNALSTTGSAAQGANEVDTGTLRVSGIAYVGQYYMTGGTSPVIAASGQFNGAGVSCPGFGIRCGSLTVADANNNGGAIACGSITVAGSMTFGSLQSSGVIVGGSYNVGNTPVINASGQFIGAGVNVGAQGVACGSLYTNQLSGNANLVSTGTLNASVQVNVTGWCANNGVYVNGQGPCIDASRQVFAYQLFAVAWSASTPVINTAGQFVGPGIVCYNHAGIDCGSLQLNSGPIDGVSTLRCNSTITASGQISGGSFSTAGTCFASGGFSGGAFTGAGVAVGSYGISCASLQVSNGPITCGSISVNGQGSFVGVNSNNGYTGGTYSGSGVSTNGSVYAAGGHQGGAFTGAGVSCPGYGINATSLQLNGPASGITVLTASTVNCSTFQINGQNMTNGSIWLGGLQASGAQVFAGSFGIYGQNVGTTGTFTVLLAGGGSVTLRFNNGIHIT
jgi:hypothetical protein